MQNEFFVLVSPPTPSIRDWKSWVSVFLAVDPDTSRRLDDVAAHQAAR